jgi:hypothetical protein
MECFVPILGKTIKATLTDSGRADLPARYAVDEITEVRLKWREN